MQGNVHSLHIPPHQKSRQSGGDQLFFCGGRSYLRHLKRTEHSTWCRLPPLWFFTFRRSISLMQSCLALASIKSNIYQEIKRGERETGQRMVLWHIEGMLRWRDLEKTEQKVPQQKSQLLLSTGVSQLWTCISICRLFLCIKRNIISSGCVWLSIYMVFHCG